MNKEPKKVDVREITGVTMDAIQGLLFQYREKGVPVTTMEIWPADSPLASANGTRDRIGLIRHMHTNKKRRRQGFMTKTLNAARFCPVNFTILESSYDDSSEEGKKFLEKNGFVKIAGKLVWRKTKTVLS